MAADDRSAARGTDGWRSFAEASDPSIAKAADAFRDANIPGWREQTFAEEVARSLDGDTLLFRVIAPIADRQGWSEPVRFLFQRRDDGTYELVIRVV